VAGAAEAKFGPPCTVLPEHKSATGSLPPHWMCALLCMLQSLQASMPTLFVRNKPGPAGMHEVLLGHGADEARACDARRRRAALLVVLARARAAPARAAHLHARPLGCPPHTVLLHAKK